MDIPDTLVKGMCTADIMVIRTAAVQIVIYSVQAGSQQLGQNPFQITFGDGILPRMSRDFAIFMAKHLAGYYL